MRTTTAAIALWVFTVPLAAVVVIAALIGIEDRPGGVYDRASHLWARGLLWGSGVRIRVEGAERLRDSLARPCVFVSNHVSWFDVFVLASLVPRFAFIAKRQLLSIPIFGPGARAVGTVPIDRSNRKSAFSSYEEAGTRIRGGRSVVVFPEGTRGATYALRDFKKGPFVLAISAGVPIVPTVVTGTLTVMPAGTWRVRGGEVVVRLLEPIATAGASYADRDRLADLVRERMAAALAAAGATEGAGDAIADDAARPAAPSSPVPRPAPAG
jgi:1-acyl-sn-glycerol-3-phosphate acyltransferase